MSCAAADVLAALAPNRSRFLAFAQARVGGEGEDVLQLALLRAATKASTLQDPERVVPWFFRILRRALADEHARRRAPGVKLELKDEATLDLAVAPAPAPEGCLCPRVVLRSLRPDYSDILRRVDVEEQPLAECAAALGITPNNAAVRLHRARNALREALVSFCGATSLAACRDCECDVPSERSLRVLED